MNLFDLLGVTVIGFCLIRGFFTGLIRELAAIIGVLGGFYAAYTYYPRLTQILQRWFSAVDYLNILSFLVLFVAVLLLISMLGLVLKYILRIAFLGWMDRTLGVVFGTLKGTLIVAVILVALTAFLPKGSPVIRDSRLAPHILGLSGQMSRVVPTEMKQRFRDQIKALKSVWSLD